MNHPKWWGGVRGEGKGGGVCFHPAEWYGAVYGMRMGIFFSSKRRDA
jgi:hypothetical protein